MQVLPVFGRVASKRVVQVLALGKVPLHLQVLILDHLLVVLIGEVVAATIIAEVVLQELIETVHVAACGHCGVRFRRRFGCFGLPLVVSGPVLTLRVSQLRHLRVVVILHCSVALVKVDSFSLLSSEFLLGKLGLALSLGDTGLIDSRHG